MNSSPFAAKSSQVPNELCGDLLKLCARETEVGQQPDSTGIAQQLEASMFIRPDHMDMRRTMIVGEDHHAPSSGEPKSR
jgi:hypothetical protein